MGEIFQRSEDDVNSRQPSASCFCRKETKGRAFFIFRQRRGVRPKLEADG